MSGQEETRTHHYGEQLLLGATNKMTVCRGRKKMIARLTGVCAVLMALTGGCTIMDQTDYKSEHSSINLGPSDLEDYGIGFLTPSAATGREADKQALAMAFSHQLQDMRPEVTVLGLPNVLSVMNAADLDVEYKQMYRDYLETGILEGSILKRISEVAGVRYFAQLSLADFRQTSLGRFSFLGMRISHTEVANLRVFVQIWDAQNANIAWEGFTELNHAYETGAEKPVTFAEISQLAAGRLFAELPGSELNGKSD